MPGQRALPGAPRSGTDVAAGGTPSPTSPDPSGRRTGVKADANTFRSAINVSHRLQNNPVFPDLYFFSALCPNGDTRPCPEAISGADPGMFVVNYRNEPVGLRVFDPARPGPDGKPGSQAAGLGGDLAYALQTRTDRAIPALNTALGGTPYPALTRDVRVRLRRNWLGPGLKN